MAKKSLLRLNVSELEQIKALRASGLTFHAIGKRLDRDHKTIAKACRAPAMTTEIERVKVTLADHFENLAVRMVVSISDKDITRINALQRTTAAAIAVDKRRLLVGLSTQNISISAIVEQIHREESERRERPARERQKGEE
ncbi:MAG: helix-turn-helix domain-containing protein [Nitrospirales bacterium]